MAKKENREIVAYIFSLFPGPKQPWAGSTQSESLYVEDLYVGPHYLMKLIVPILYDVTLTSKRVGR